MRLLMVLLTLPQVSAAPAEGSWRYGIDNDGGPLAAPPNSGPTTPSARAPPGASSSTCTMGLNAKTFGATGDGVTDDTAALQKAIDAAQELGRRLLVPAGQCGWFSPHVSICAMQSRNAMQSVAEIPA
eukprot:SAG31_NODE_2955_length_4860_cov_3.219072_2_plen_128_part_00